MKKTIFALIASVGVIGAASAQISGGTPYVGIGGVVSEHRYELNNDSSGGDTNKHEYGGKVFAGYQITPMYGVEIGYTDFGKSSYAYNVNGAAGRAEADAKSYYLAAKAAYPIAEKTNLTGKLGVAHNKNDVWATGLASNYNGDSSRNALYAAVGAEYAVNEKVSLSLEYEHYGKNDIDLGRSKGAVSLGARYNF
ncbi:OOP family OmpA-OmpF porin [Pseudoduganella lurida]|uniref:OOP family OmpA-OmpF porin n=1 Tax=Pseudoduganella lurida TaxID=1036180 RepID=A0A562R1L9_9BURK|nr:outer membrane beta-barrel protein [Pseudoduganella lurida]TWI62941.1 OOP family OmpA-OmpF porin [Pseudoduganella lurida]